MNKNLSGISLLHDCKSVVKRVTERYKPDFTAKFLLVVQELLFLCCLNHSCNITERNAGIGGH